MGTYRLEFTCGSGSQVCYFSIAAASADDFAKEFQAFAANSQIASMMFMERPVLVVELHDDSGVKRVDAIGALTVSYDDGDLTADERGFPQGLGIEVPTDIDTWEAVEWMLVNPDVEDRLLFTEPTSVALDLAKLGLPLLDGKQKGEHAVLKVDEKQVKHPWGLVGDICLGYDFESA